MVEAGHETLTDCHAHGCCRHSRSSHLYPYYNCAWALRAGMMYTDVFADTAHKAYVDSCANYLATHNLIRIGTTGFYDRVNPPVLAWGAGNLYEHGVREEDSLWQEAGWKRGRRARNWVEADPPILGNEEWAMSGGAVVWGVLESYFREFSEEESLWVAQYAALMDTVADPGNWENAWQGWYALGERRLERSTGDPVWGDRHRALTDYLRAFDSTDMDGGIQAQPSDADTMDQSWVTAYLGFMGLDSLAGTATLVPFEVDRVSPGPVWLLPNRPNPFNPATTIPFDLESAAHVVLEVTNVAGERVVRLMDRSLPAGAHAATWDGTDRRGRQAPAGVYFFRLQAGEQKMTKKMVLVR